MKQRLAALRDPGVQAVVVLLALAVGGFVLMGAAWRGAARNIYVPLQLPWFVSGGLAGLGLVGLSLGALSIHLGRRDDAAHRAAVDEVVREAAELAEQLRGSGRLSRGRG